MKYLPLIWATLWRKKIRTVLTLLSIIIAFLLFGMLEAVGYAFTHPSEGVTGAVSGYAGGQKSTARYETVGGGDTGRAESVKVIYDPRHISYPPR